MVFDIVKCLLWFGAVQNLPPALCKVTNMGTQASASFRDLRLAQDVLSCAISH